MRPIIDDDQDDSDRIPTTRYESDRIGQLEPVKQESDDSLFRDKTSKRKTVVRQESEELFKERAPSSK